MDGPIEYAVDRTEIQRIQTVPRENQTNMSGNYRLGDEFWGVQEAPSNRADLIYTHMGPI